MQDPRGAHPRRCLLAAQALVSRPGELRSTRPTEARPGWCPAGRGAAVVSPAPASPPWDSGVTGPPRAGSHRCWPPSAPLASPRGLTLKPPRPPRPMGVRRPCTTTTSEAEACGKPAEQGAACSAELDSGRLARCPSTTCSRCIADVGPTDSSGLWVLTTEIKKAPGLHRVEPIGALRFS